jgi:hypothetical protein
MAMRMPKTTIRRLMVIVLLIGTSIWAGLAATRTRSNKSRAHLHYNNECDLNAPLRDFSQTRAWVPFWPVYWRTLLGLRWDWRYNCVTGDGSREVACDHDFPQLNHRDDHGRIRGVNFELLQAVFTGQPSSQR